MTIPHERLTMRTAIHNVGQTNSLLRVFASVAAALLFTLPPAMAQQRGTEALDSPFEDFMKALTGPRPTPNSSESGRSAIPPANRNGGRSDLEPRPGIDPRNPTYIPPNSRTPYNQPGADGTRTIPDRFDNRRGYPYGTGDRGEDRRGYPAELEPGFDLPLQNEADEAAFDWKQQTTSIADLRFPTSTVFRQGDAWLETEEETAYLDMINTIARQRERLLDNTTRDRLSASQMRATWEEAFYLYTHARRLAWDNGQLRKEVVSDILSGVQDPFRKADAPTTSMTEAAQQLYSVYEDISDYPDDFVGRPVVLIGMFTRNSTVRIPNELRAAPPVSGRIPDKPMQLTVSRGTLTAIGSNRKLATVDTQNLSVPEVISNTPVSFNQGPIPVLVKGWIVKNWDGKPLIYSETVRLLSAIPHNDLIRISTIDKRRLQDEEKWIYYETLSQLELTSTATQKEVADRVLSERIDSLMQEVSRKASESLATLNSQLKLGKITEPEFRQQKVSLQRQMSQRVDRYRKYRKQPDEFQTYVDLFQNPEVWHGKLLTLKGHVRHVVSYPADEILFGKNKMLHELWLFTDDSQHNPAVIVTPHLPSDFPTDASVIDSVSVTGCFLKRYVYGSQDSARIAPLLLAGRVNWLPTADQIQRLVKEGDLPAKSVRAQKAAALTSGEIGETAMTLICVFVILVLMILWGRAQREERDRIRLRKRVDEVPVFESPLLPGYSAAHSEFLSDSDNGLNLPY